MLPDIRRHLAELPASARQATKRLQTASAPAVSRTQPAARAARGVLGAISRPGWLILASSGVLWIAGRYLGWQELLLMSFAGLVLVALCGLLSIGRNRLRVEIEVDPHRVVVGGSAAGQVRVINKARQTLVPIAVELPIGADAARFSVPPIATGAQHDELFVVPTQRRGVIPI
jgi:uncharacterized protein (DUF58 family)